MTHLENKAKFERKIEFHERNWRTDNEDIYLEDSNERGCYTVLFKMTFAFRFA
jgi:hypothetical protein